MSVDATIATWKLTKKQVTSTEKLFLLTCADRAGENGICWPSIKRICSDTCLDRKTVIDVRQSVIEKGLLEYTGDYTGKTKLIPIMRLTYIQERCEEELNNTENGTVHFLNSPENGTDNSPENGTVKQSRKRDTESIIREPLIGTDHFLKNKQKKPNFSKHDYFLDFWTIFPVKKAEIKCKKLWLKKNLNNDDIGSLILERLQYQLYHDYQWAMGYLPSAYNYINGELWNDDIVMSPEHLQKTRVVARRCVNNPEVEKRIAEQEAFSKKQFELAQAQWKEKKK